MDSYVSDLVKYRLDKASDELELAEHCIKFGKFSKSLNCSYYAISRSARALLAVDLALVGQKTLRCNCPFYQNLYQYKYPR
jgi:hypothetical protein